LAVLLSVFGLVYPLQDYLGTYLEVALKLGTTVVINEAKLFNISFYDQQHLSHQGERRASSLSVFLPSELLTDLRNEFYHTWFFASKKLGSLSSCSSNRIQGTRDLLIAIATVNIEDRPVSYYPLTRSLMAEYARRHCYDFHVLRKPLNLNTNRSMHWQKVLSSIHLLTQGHRSVPSMPHNGGRPYDYLFWIDADTIIMNLNHSLEDIVAMALPEKDIIISGDTCIINSAQVLWRNSEATIRTLERLWGMDCDPPPPIYENGQFASMIGGCEPHDTPEAKQACYNRVNFYKGKEARRVSTHIKAGNISGIPIADWAKRTIHWVPKTIMNSYRDDFRPGHFIFHSVAVGGHHKKSGWLSKMYNESLLYNNMNNEELLEQYSLVSRG
jgi:hypothetical protein